MKQVIWLWILTVAMYGANPTAFSGLGDPIFNAVPQIEQLARTKVYSAQQEKIHAFLEACVDVKARGLALEEKGQDPKKIKRYLNKLRHLDTEYQRLLHGVDVALKRSITMNDYEGFVELMETDMIDFEKQVDLILPFYQQHRETYQLEAIENYLAYLEQSNALAEQERAEKAELYDAYKKRRLEDVNRRQAAKKAAYRKAVEMETERKKEQVHRTQEEELGIQR